MGLAIMTEKQKWNVNSVGTNLLLGNLMFSTGKMTTNDEAKGRKQFVLF
jgi:hypothetical protein